ncbi:MAG TPA: PilZ domain-containing protein [Gemmataceae bacterium]|nr:PilZ domain-containing protein [Gemmataceae bacterium]
MSDVSTRDPRCRIQCRERRASVRHATMMEASYHPIAVAAFGPSCPARIWDVSLGGMALVVPHCYEPGEVLSVVPEVLPESLSPALEARVLDVTPHGEGQWMARCQFLTPLSEDELNALLY